ncbi:phospholipase A [uncultured Aquimarina sp.]|uniref:phospholipase A n=1 Tax=uncultured Aquimarina sp. TaxID=575652 RepID=UPI00260E8D01|nr:phospholipase A [uncultured Aquimarina sp.]
MDIPKARITFVSIFLIATLSKAQERISTKIDSTNYKEIIHSLPTFTIFGDNYIITGTALNEKPDSDNSDAKFQLGFKQRITNLDLPWDAFLFFTYRQKSFWNVYKESFPFRESNYNPGLGFAKLFFKNNEISSGLWFQFEHESNGRDRENSRSWNYFSLLYIKPYLNQWQFRIKGWAPIGSIRDNPDLLEYRGYFEGGISYRPWKSLIFEGDFRKSFSSDWRGSLKLGVSYKISKNSNQFIYLQYYLGYAEDLINYTESVSRLRIGITFKDLSFKFK